MIEMNAKEIGKRLVRLRGNKTQEEVAKSLNISVSALSMYERGERIPRDNVKIRISSYYKKPINKIFLSKTTRNVSERKLNGRSKNF